MSEQVVPGGHGWGIRTREEKTTTSARAAAAGLASAPVFSPAAAWTEEGLIAAAAAYEAAGYPRETAQAAALAYAQSAYPPEAYAAVAPPSIPPAGPSPATAPARPAAWEPSTTAADTPAGRGLGAFIPGKGWVADAHPDDLRKVRTVSPKRRRAALIPFGIAGRIGVSAIVGLVLFGLFGTHSWITNLLHSQHHVTTPQAVQGAGIITSGPLSSVSMSLSSAAHKDSHVIDVVAAYYGVAPDVLPDYAVMAIRHSGSSLTGSDLQDVVKTVTGGTWSAALTTDTRNGVTYTCENYTDVEAGKAITGVACVWDDYDVAGMVISFKDFNADRMLNTTQSVHDTVEGSK